MAREDWKIIRAVSEVVGSPLPYDTLSEVRQRMAQVAPHLTKLGAREEANYFRQGVALSKAMASLPLDPGAPLQPSLLAHHGQVRGGRPEGEGKPPRRPRQRKVPQ